MDNLMYIIENTTIEQLKEELNKNSFAEKDLKDFMKGKELVDGIIDLGKTNMNKNVGDALVLYCIYKLKGGK